MLVYLIDPGNDQRDTALYREFITGLTELGYTCIYRPVLSAGHNQWTYRIMTRLIMVWHGLVNRRLQKILDEVNEEAPSAVIVIKGTFIFPETVRRLKAESRAVICYNPDNPYNTKSCGDEIRACIGHYDRYGTWSRSVMEKLEADGQSDVRYVTFATPSLTNGISNKACPTTFKYTISFVGNADEYRIRVVSDLARMWKQLGNDCHDIHLFGWGWNALMDVSIHVNVDKTEYASIVRNSMISMNILRKANKNSVNMRTFEIPAFRGLMLHENSQEAKRIYPDNHMAIYYANGADAAIKVDKIKNNMSHILSIRIAAYRHAHKYEQSYSKRMHSLLSGT